MVLHYTEQPGITYSHGILAAPVIVLLDLSGIIYQSVKRQLR